MYQKEFCDQSYKGSMMVNYNYRVVIYLCKANTLNFFA